MNIESSKNIFIFFLNNVIAYHKLYVYYNTRITMSLKKKYYSFAYAEQSKLMD